MFSPRGVADAAAAAIVDEHPVEWTGAEALASTPAEKALLAQLRTLEQIDRRSRVDRGISLVAESGRPDRLAWTILITLAAIQVCASIAAVAFLTGFPAIPLVRYQLAITVSFALAALVLIRGGAGDVRARHLGHFHLLCAAAFSQGLLGYVMYGAGPRPALVVLHRVYPEALLAYAAWRFANAFPRSDRFTRFDRFARRAAVASIAVGVLLCVGSWIAFTWTAPPDGRLAGLAWTFRRRSNGLGFWMAELVLMLPAIGSSIWRLHVSATDERRRAAWFVGGIAAGIAPLFLQAVIRGLSPSFNAWILTSHSAWRTVVDTVVLLAMLSIPFSTGYAVIVRRVLNARLAVRGALTYAMARYSLIALMAAGGTTIALDVYHHRDWRVVDALSRPGAIAGLAALVAAGLLLEFRPRMLRVIDRRFGGMALDDASAIGEAASAIGRGRTRREIATAAVTILEQTLDVQRAALLVRKGAAFHAFHSGLVPVLASDSALPELLADAPAALVGPDTPTYSLLPVTDQEWLARGGFDAVARIPSPVDGVAALAAFGGRRDGSPFSERELRFVETVMTTVGLALDRPRADATDTAPPAQDDGALECERCGALGVPPACRCGAPLVPARLPAVLSGRFDVLRRVGRGGMGVVYLGRDSRLGRLVALKTLPDVTAAAATAMFGEARAMASVEHPGLAVIYSLELWQSTPILVVEFLGGGTLADRLADGPLAAADALSMGAALADALAALHAAGVIHRDIKPSNIGFTRDGVPKLLDFGVARLLTRAQAAEPGGLPAAHAMTSTAIAGTPLYLSPEALRGEPVGEAVDLWSLSVTVAEACLGAYPFRGRSARGVVDRLRRGDDTLARRWRGQAPDAVAALFDRALHPDRQQRPSAASRLAQEMREAASSASARR